MSLLLAHITRDHIELTNAVNGKTAMGSALFSSPRLLVGDIEAASALLKSLVKQVASGGLLAAKPKIVVQPLEMTEGGLSPVEERIFMELGLSAGAREAKVQVGEKLTTDAAIALLKGGGAAGKLPM